MKTTLLAMSLILGSQAAMAESWHCTSGAGRRIEVNKDQYGVTLRIDGRQTQPNYVGVSRSGLQITVNNLVDGKDVYFVFGTERSTVKVGLFNNEEPLPCQYTPDRVDNGPRF